ncbi:MAG: MOSC domain-containing protein [Anaerolineae bacterium]|nr:MOSC domain-containing protein [Anaerolineae bacterium]NUQ03820.1 MOSC domain-containing protein [Anaerolineae bacterium]
MAVVVTDLYVYPVKSCGGIRQSSAVVEPRGFAYDRRWLIVDHDGGFLTQRVLPRMALIAIALTADALTLTAPGVETLRVPYDQPGERTAVTIWRNSGVGAIDQGDVISVWLSDFLKKPVRLVRFADDAVRQVDQRYAPRPTDQVGFADAYPFMILSEESVGDLNARLDVALPMNRFRPNIVVRGAGAYAEDTWRRIAIGDVIFEVVKPCARCAITSTDQETARRGKEPLRTLAMYRDSERGVLFGQNMTHQGAGVVRVGDAVRVLD